MATAVHYEFWGNAVSHVLSVDEVAEVRTVCPMFEHCQLTHMQSDTGVALAAKLKMILDAFGIENKVC